MIVHVPLEIKIWSGGGLEETSLDMVLVVKEITNTLHCNISSTFAVLSYDDVTTKLPSWHWYFTCEIRFMWAGIVYRHARRRRSQILQVWSSLPVAMWYLKHAVCTTDTCVSKQCTVRAADKTSKSNKTHYIISLQIIY
jgi:hypothetical protein